MKSILSFLLLAATALPVAATIRIYAQFGTACNVAGAPVPDGTLWALIVDTNGDGILPGGFGANQSLTAAGVAAFQGRTIEIGSVFAGDAVFALGGVASSHTEVPGSISESLGLVLGVNGLASGRIYAFYWFPGVTYGGAHMILNEVGGINSLWENDGGLEPMIIPDDYLMATQGAAEENCEGTIPKIRFTAVLAPPVDSDGDGMPDSWELAHNLNPASESDGTSDTDHDGVFAFLEYALAMNPEVSDLALLPRLGYRDEPDGKHATLNYQRPKNSGLTYAAERSVTLETGNWQSGITVFQELTPLDLGNGSESVTIVDLNPMAGTPRAWYRLRVSK
ncbi:MAG: hypothetical protein MUF04_09595 [Akkermansiaceae bacterium]|jgi:hypothetical protein|nr:hypothetical protein [Akkermansiaceae bacterium]